MIGNIMIYVKNKNFTKIVFKNQNENNTNKSINALSNIRLKYK